MAEWIIFRGAGDIATGCILRLKRCGYRVAALETEKPLAIRRTVALSEAVYEGEARVEDVRARRVDKLPAEADFVPVLVDPAGEILKTLRPAALVDATLAKRNLGTHRDMAPAVIALGPGFAAGEDVHAVVETMRGHDLGRVIWRGPAAKNTGIPGVIGGQSAKRVIHAPCAGRLHVIKDIGSQVEEGDVLAEIGGVPVCARIPGLVRGMLREGFEVPAGLKMADVDPRRDTEWNSVSDKARAVAGGVLEALLAMGVKP